MGWTPQILDPLTEGARAGLLGPGSPASLHPEPTRSKLLQALILAPENGLRSHLADFLAGRGFGVSCFSSVADALTHKGPLQFALVSLDLPDRPGWQFWNHLATDERAPLALFWGPDPIAWERLSLRTNQRTAFLQSPFEPKALLRALVELEQYRTTRI